MTRWIVVGGFLAALALLAGCGGNTADTAGLPPATTGATATPTFTPNPGTYASAQTIVIGDATPGAVIYYTANGATPTTSSSTYLGPITVSATQAVIQAIAIAAGHEPSAVATATYTICPPHQAPVGSQGEWTWASGSSAVNQYGYYGTLGAAGACNTPGARVQSATWTDHSGNLWLFGGFGSSALLSGGDLNDLWEYSGGQWTWVGGSDQAEQQGVYGTKGAAAPGNAPGGRYEAASWTDPQGSFWLFGGLGLDSVGARGYLNDLWRYSGGQWEWIAGTRASDRGLTNAQRAGVYGTLGVPSPNNIPGARIGETTWADHAGNLSLYGGEGYDSTGALGMLTDLWRYSGDEWTWMDGPSTTAPLSQPGIYGVQGTPAPNNAPGPRTGATGWTDADGNLWLFGGEGNDSTGGAICSAYGGPCLLNDLWKYSKGEWTWVGGSNLNNQPGTYGTAGIAAPSNIPGARWLAVSDLDAAGNVWLFGGIGLDSTTGAYTVFGDLNDLWKYSNGQWTWVSGSTKAGQLGSYGIQSVPAPGSTPGSRDSAVSWIDASGNLWLFGGDDSFTIVGGGRLNDLWEYQP